MAADGNNQKAATSDKLQLDLSGLYALAARGKEKANAKTASKTATDASNQLTQPNTRNEIYMPSQPNTGAINKLQRQADLAKQKREDSETIYKEYQKNIQRSAQIQADILRGVKAGEDPHTLLLMACKAVSLMTSSNDFYNQVEADIRAICGQGLWEQRPIQDQIAETKERLHRLQASMGKEANQDAKERIIRAIRAHEERITALERLNKDG